MRKKYAILLGAIGIAAVIIGGIFLLTPSRPMFGIFPEVKGEGVLGVYELWWSHENYLNAEVEVEGVLKGGGPSPSRLWLTQWVKEAENDYLVCIICTDYEFSESFFTAHIRVRGIVKPPGDEPFSIWHISVEDAEYVSPPPQGYPVSLRYSRLVRR